VLAIHARLLARLRPATALVRRAPAAARVVARARAARHHATAPVRRAAAVLRSADLARHFGRADAIAVVAHLVGHACWRAYPIAARVARLRSTLIAFLGAGHADR